MASRTNWGSKGRIAVSTAMRSLGGVSMTDRSRTPASDSWRVRGTGVADMARTWTSFLSCLSFSFCATPKRCSSSTMSRPSLGISTSRDSRRWVPTRTSTWPAASFFFTSRISAAERKREIISIDTGKPAKRFWKVSRCWSARMVVGASTATW